MAESELLVSPQDTGDAVELSASQRVYRKRILPKATINYRGRKIRFDDEYLADLAQSFDAGAYDQVAFMLAPDNNSHTLDPERFRGELQGVDVQDDGLYATIQVTPEAAKVLEENPKLGVSARILENYMRSDGKHFPRALQHVLGTLDPVIPGLGAWEEVALSNGVLLENVIDLSETSYEELEHMATRAEHLEQVAKATDMSMEDLEALEMTDDELAIFASAFGDTGETAPEATAADDDDELIEETGIADIEDAVTEDAEADAEAVTDAENEGLPTDEEIAAAVEALSDEELEQLAAELGVETEDDETAAEDETTAEEAPTEEVAPEPTDAELAARLGAGEFGSGLGDIHPDPDLADLTDEALAQMWDTAAARDRAVAETRAEALDAEVEAADADEGFDPVDQITEVVPEAVETAPADARELVGAGALSLSNDAAPEVVALANQLASVQHQLAVQQFDSLKAEYVRKGVPAALVDLARPVLIAGPAATLELSNPVGGVSTVDAAAIVRELLDSATGYIDLARERGHGYSLDGDARAAAEADTDKRLASLWGEQYDKR